MNLLNGFKNRVFYFLANGILLMFCASGCGGTTAGNPLVTLEFGSYSARNQFFELLIPSAFAATSNIKLCFRRLRFKTERTGTSTLDDNVDFQPGEITLNSASSTQLGQIVVPAGTYRRVEFDLAPNGAGCTSGNSVSFANANGSYTSPDTITIKFDGTFVASGSSQRLTLGVQAIVDALNAVTGPSGASSTVKTTMEAASGSF